MSLSLDMPIVLYADQDHRGLRAVALLLLPACVALVYWLLLQAFRLLAPADMPGYVVLFAAILGLPVGLGLAAAAERGLKRVWRSGSRVDVSEGVVAAWTRRGENGRIDLAREFVCTHWYFELRGYPRGGSERRVPAHWLCVCTQVEQDDQRIVVFTLLPPARAARLIEIRPVPYREIFPADIYRGRPARSSWVVRSWPARPEISADVLRGKDGRFWLAERHRWREGMELTPQDYEILTQIIQSDGGSHV
ncbi:MAG: hypothetical protein KC425_14280 [Anaerolineales bacterium]|nr:hypothetical protein [Anaerolineales bacterium]